MIIRGTANIKGVLDLSGINKQLSPGDRLPITDDQFNDPTVQMAINMGLLTYEKGNLAVGGESKSIKLRNIYDRAIRINTLDADIRPQGTFILTEDQVSGSDIRGALAKGLIEIVSSNTPADIKETTLKVGPLFAEDAEPLKRPPVDQSDFLETNEELGAPKIIDEVEPMNVIDTEDPDPVQKGDIADPKKKSIVWNPNKDPLAHTRTGMDAISASKSGLKSEETNIDIGDISFVDEELAKERLENHPILKNKPTEVENDIDFL